MEYGIGILLGILIILFARGVGFDRDRSFYPTVLIVIASYYVLFAVIGGTVQALLIECAVMAAFVLVAVIGFKFNLWIIAAAMVGHGVFDYFHGGIVTNEGMPEWWPAFCMSIDISAGVCFAIVLRRSRPTP